jgi:hypothetical protein
MMAHVVLSIAPSTSDPVPGGHFTHVSLLVAPAVLEYVPALQFRQVALLDCAAAPEYVPGGHAWHLAIFSVFSMFENVPVGHAVHVALPAGEIHPSVHCKIRTWCKVFFLPNLGNPKSSAMHTTHIYLKPVPFKTFSAVFCTSTDPC